MSNADGEEAAWSVGMKNFAELLEERFGLTEEFVERYYALKLLRKQIDDKVKD
jgi:hypothetical protein